MAYKRLTEQGNPKKKKVSRRKTLNKLPQVLFSSFQQLAHFRFN